jgi:hypothetical protein
MERIIGALIFAIGLAVGFVIGKEVYERPALEKVPGTSQSTSSPSDAGNPEKK